MLTEEQRKQRINGIGASDTPIIMGYSSFKTPYQLYLEKTGVITAEDDFTELQYWGNALEPLILRRFEEENNVKISHPDTVYHPTHPYIFANLDGWVDSERAVVEAKCANSFQRGKWDSACSDGIPLQYLVQLAKQCAITDASRGYCAVLIGGMEYMQFTYERDKALEDLIIQADVDFWECVTTRREPDAINTSDCRLKYNQPHPDKVVETTFKTSHALNELIKIKSQSKLLAENEDFQKMQLMNHLGNSEYLVGQEGEILVSWKANKKGTRVFNIKG